MKYALRPCPWCDGVPVWVTRSLDGRAVPWGSTGRQGARALACIVPQCTVKPHTPWRGANRFGLDHDMQDVEAWNTRVPPPGASRSTPPKPSRSAAMEELLSKVNRNIDRIEELTEQQIQIPNQNTTME